MLAKTDGRGMTSRTIDFISSKVVRLSMQVLMSKQAEQVFHGHFMKAISYPVIRPHETPNEEPLMNQKNDILFQMVLGVTGLPLNPNHLPFPR